MEEEDHDPTGVVAAHQVLGGGAIRREALTGLLDHHIDNHHMAQDRLQLHRNHQDNHHTNRAKLELEAHHLGLVGVSGLLLLRGWLLVRVLPLLIRQ